MKSQLNKILTLIIILLFFSFSKSYSIEGVNELTDAINEAKEEFNNLSESSNQQSKIIDEAIKDLIQKDNLAPMLGKNAYDYYSNECTLEKMIEGFVKAINHYE